MIIGIGMDLIEVERVAELLRRRGAKAARRLFTGAEVEYCEGSRSSVESYAARFAAKEALFKALGTGWARGVTWGDVEIVPGAGGAPRMNLYGAARAAADARGVCRIHVTLSHTRELAAAYVVLEAES